VTLIFLHCLTAVCPAHSVEAKSGAAFRDITDESDVFLLPLLGKLKIRLFENGYHWMT